MGSSFEVIVLLFLGFIAYYQWNICKKLLEISSDIYKYHNDIIKKIESTGMDKKEESSVSPLVEIKKKRGRPPLK